MSKIFVSTRGQSPEVTFSEAVQAGLAPDGGLYLPKALPDLGPHLEEWEGLSYPRLCTEFFSLFADLPKERLASIVDRSYRHFTDEAIAPLVPLDENLAVLELFHGPTLAFKDFALQLLGNLYEEQIARTGQSIHVLGATSGDTGAAAIHGLLGKKGVQIYILYPDGGVSPLQEMQMTRLEAENVFPIAIEGPFDDAQHMVKEAFADVAFKQEVQLSAVNSINLARILAQCVYYLYAWLQLPDEKRETVEFVVPTGNFGNVLAGWLVQQMGVPMGGFCVATNQNDILYRLFNSGDYEVQEVIPSVAPSMDIQVASNFERFLYYMKGESGPAVCEVMQQFKAEKSYHFDAFAAHSLRASKCDDSEIKKIIAAVKEKYHYTVDPHTACAFADLQEDRLSVVLATAHPAKFPDTLKECTGEEPQSAVLEALKSKQPMKYHLEEDTTEAVKAFVCKHKQSS